MWCAGGLRWSILRALSSRSHAAVARWLERAGGLYLLYALAQLVRDSLRWPLVGDATLLHYCVLMLRQGYAPYRQLIDINLPGTYFVEWAVIRMFGYGALPWRLFDLLLLAVIAAAAFAVVAQTRGWRAAWFPALWAIGVFTLLHGRDGLPQLGQRDLLVAAQLAVAIACLLQAHRRRGRGAPGLAAAACFGLAVGMAATVKPLALFLLPCLLVSAHRRHGAQAHPGNAAQAQAPLAQTRGAWRLLTAACLGTLVPLAAACAYLLQEHALTAFVTTMTQLVPLHSSLFRLSPLRLVGSCVSSVLLPVLLLGLPAVASTRPWRSVAGRVLLAGAAFGVLSYVVQGRGYPYHRYPLHLCLLLLYACALPEAFRTRRTGATNDPSTGLRVDEPTLLQTAPRVGSGIGFWVGSRAAPWVAFIPQVSALLALLAGTLVLVPRSLSAVQHFTPAVDPFGQALSAVLVREDAVAGQVQCFDMAGGCVTTLLNRQLPQSTGFLYDCYAFLPVAPAFQAEQQRYRTAWLAAMTAKPPRLLIVTSDECGPADQLYRKLTWWPAFASLLATHYTLAATWTPQTPERWTGQTATLPYGFRVYRQR